MTPRTAPTTVEVDGRRYDIVGVCHETRRREGDLAPPPHFRKAQTDALRHLSASYDLVLLEDGLITYTGVQGESLCDSVMYELYGFGCQRLGYLRHRMAADLIGSRWLRRSLRDTIHLAAKEHILAVQLWFQMHAESYDDLAYLRETCRIMFEAWPHVFPGCQPTINATRRSLLQAWAAPMAAEEHRARNTLLIVGADHEPQVAVALSNPRYSDTRLLYHLPP